MARKSPDGRYIISAGEVSEYAMCPEAWRLQRIEKVNSHSYSDFQVKEGKRLHTAWANEYDEAQYLSYNAKLLILMVLVAVIAYILTH